MLKKNNGIFFNSLLIRLSFILIGIPTIILVAFGLYRTQTQTRFFERMLDEMIRNEAIQLSASLAAPLFNYDNDVCSAICMAALKKKEIIQITVYDLDKTYLSYKDHAAAASHRKADEKIVQAPVTINHENIGKVEVVATNAVLREKIAEFKVGNALLIIGIDIIMGMVLIVVLNLWLIRPLQALKKSSEKIAAGRLDYPVYIYRKDELGQLADNFMTMRDSIKEKVSNLQLEIQHHRETSLALEKSESFLRLIIDIIPHSVLVKDKNGRILIANKAIAEDLNKSVDELTGKIVSEVIGDSKTAGKIIEDDRHLILKGETQSFVRRTHCAQTKVSKWFSTKKVPFKGHEGEKGLVEITSNITDLKITEAELKRTKNYIDNIINSMPSALFSLDNDLKITLWNLKAEKNYGISASHALSRPVLEVLPGMGRYISRIRKTVDTGEPCHFSKQPNPHDGETVFEDITIYPIVSDRIEGAVIRVDDSTEKVRMEEMVLQSEKMVSIGGLAAGMAHELNNPLAGMMQNAQVILRRIQRPIPGSLKAADEVGVSMDQIRLFMEKRGIIRQLDLIHDAGVRASKIVKNMLSFSRRDLRGREKQDISELLDRTIEVAKNDYDLKRQYDFKKIRIERDYDPKTPMVMCEVTKIQQVFFNILKNSAQAMHEYATDRDPCFYLRVSSNQGFVRVEIEDNGPGIETQSQKRVFEPFFTTKPVGKGTGLGLSVSYFIVTDHHKGKMDVTSAPGKGAVFTIQLPV